MMLADAQRGRARKRGAMKQGPCLLGGPSCLEADEGSSWTRFESGGRHAHLYLCAVSVSCFIISHHTHRQAGRANPWRQRQGIGGMGHQEGTACGAHGM